MALRVAFVDLESRLPNITNQYMMPRHGILQVGTATRAAGYEVGVYIESLNGVPYHELLNYDVVGASVTGSNMSRIEALFRSLRRDRPGMHLIAGGPQATLIPTDVARFADIVVRDEGEDAIIEVLRALESGGDLSAISGLSLPRGTRVHHTARRTFSKRPGLVEDLTLLRNFRRKSLPEQIVRDQMLYCGYATTSRGCPFPCTFCYENMIGGTGFRKQPSEVFLDDVRSKRDFFGVRHFWLADSNFTTNPAHCNDILRAIIAADLGCEFSALCRVDVARRPQTLDLMRQAGFKILVLGMESIQDDKLHTLEKRQSVDEIKRAIAEIHRYGMRVIGLFMMGFDEDDADSPDRIVNFCEQNRVDSMSIYCLTEYPSLPGRTLPRYRVCELDMDYYNGHFVTTFPLQLRPSVLEQRVFAALSRFYHPRKMLQALRQADPRQALMLLGHLLQFRKMTAASDVHQLKLRAIEEPYYGADGRLREAFLRENPLLKTPLHPDVLADWQDPAALAPLVSIKPRSTAVPPPPV